MKLYNFFGFLNYIAAGGPRADHRRPCRRAGGHVHQFIIQRQARASTAGKIRLAAFAEGLHTLNKIRRARGQALLRPLLRKLGR